MDYPTYVATLANLLVYQTTDTNFVQILPEAISYAELRMYRELDLLSTVVRDSSASLTVNSRNFTLPQTLGRFVTVQGINVLLTATTRSEMVSAAREFVDFTYPNEAAVGSPSIPAFYAMLTDQTIIIGPAPGSAYSVEVIGTIRPTPLSGANTTTFLTLYIPDAFLAASMIFATGWQRDFGAMSDDPTRAISWESQYEMLMKSANTEELRKRYNRTMVDTTSSGGTK